jgi:hypothetical protein
MYDEMPPQTEFRWRGAQDLQPIFAVDPGNRRLAFDRRA